MNAAEMVAREYAGPCRRVGDRRTWNEPATGFGDCGKTISNRVAAHAEIDLIEAQCAQEAAQERLAHAIAAAQLLVNELRLARAASVAARRAARDACGVLSGAES